MTVVTNLVIKATVKYVKKTKIKLLQKLAVMKKKYNQ